MVTYNRLSVNHRNGPSASLPLPLHGRQGYQPHGYVGGRRAARGRRDVGHSNAGEDRTGWRIRQEHGIGEGATWCGLGYQSGVNTQLLR